GPARGLRAPFRTPCGRRPRTNRALAPLRGRRRFPAAVCEGLGAPGQGRGNPSRALEDSLGARWHERPERRRELGRIGKASFAVLLETALDDENHRVRDIRTERTQGKGSLADDFEAKLGQGLRFER